MDDLEETATAEAQYAMAQKLTAHLNDHVLPDFAGDAIISVMTMLDALASEGLELEAGSAAAVAYCTRLRQR
jgi:hypothetical protein